MDCGKLRKQPVAGKSSVRYLPSRLHACALLGFALRDPAAAPKDRGGAHGSGTLAGGADESVTPAAPE